MVDAKLQAEVIKLLKLPDCYVSQQAFESIKLIIEDEIGPLESLNETTIIGLELIDSNACCDT